MRIVSEEKRPVRALPRPSPARVHPWETDLQAPTGLYVDPETAEKVERQLARAAKAGTESMGLLLGDRFTDPDGTIFSTAFSAATAPVEATATHVRWAEEAMADLAGALEALPFDFVIVGMYHSHLAGACAPSQIDIDNQRKYFASPHQVSWILNPAEHKAAAYALVNGAPGRRRVALFSGGAGATDAYLTRKPSPRISTTRGLYTPR